MKRSGNGATDLAGFARLRSCGSLSSAIFLANESPFK